MKIKVGGLEGEVLVGNALAPACVTVGLTSAVAVEKKDNRRLLLLTNTSANAISIAFGEHAAVLYSGVTLNAGGGVLELATPEAVSAIAAGAGSNLAIQEFE